MTDETNIIPIPARRVSTNRTTGWIHIRLVPDKPLYSAVDTTWRPGDKP